MGEQRPRPRRTPDEHECDQKAEPSPPPPAKIKPVKERVGESAGNLRRRQAWFRKRTSDPE
jgi:hypothetical protein